jgi:hypothetical protein
MMPRGFKHTAETLLKMSMSQGNKNLPPISVDGVVARIPLSGKYGAGLFVTVDANDLPLVIKYSWHLSDKGYVVRSGQGRSSMHRMLVAAPADMTIDHIDGDRLNNRRLNLRPVTQEQQMQNVYRKVRLGRPTASQYRGVTRIPGSKPKPWRASVRVNGVYVFRRCFADEESAALAASEARCKFMTHSVESRHPVVTTEEIESTCV